MPGERRVKRSEELSEALALQLAASAERARFSSLSLAEERGLLVAGCGDPEELQEIAALAPELAGRSCYWQGQAQTEAGCRLVSVALVDTSLGSLYLCGVGGSVTAIWAELRHSRRGVTRIVA